MEDRAPIAVVETRKMMAEEERTALVDFLSTHPEAGDLIQGTGGVRKLRWALEGRGKSGGARVIHFYYNADMPLFLLSAFAKNEKSDLTGAERNDFKRLTGLLVEHYGKAKP